MSIAEEGLRVGEVIGYSYRIIARGAPLDIGIAHQAFDMKHGKVVSMLLLSPSFGTGRDLLARLEKSRLSVAALAKDPLLPFEHVGLIEGRLYLVRGHAEGHSLTSLLARYRRLHPSTAADIAFRVADALAPLHQAGLVHGGLSSRCVIVAGDGQVAVADTGLLPVLRPTPSRRSEPWGRFPYLAPEQAAGTEPDPASDVYAIGLLLHEMLTGRLPYPASDRSSLIAQLTGGELPAALDLPSPVPAALAQIVERALAPELPIRYRNAGQLANILSLQTKPTPAVQESDRASVWRLVVPAPPAPADPGTGRRDDGHSARARARPHWLIIALIIAVILALLALVPLWLSIRPRASNPAPTPEPVAYHLQLPPAAPAPPGLGSDWPLAAEYRPAPGLPRGPFAP